MCCCCCCNTGKVEGEVLLNSRPLTRKVARSTVSYVEQDNTLLESLSVEEMLCYTAALCWPWKPRAWRNELVDSLISTLGLQKCRDSRIGGSTLRGISGGEARRAFIAASLVGKPQVLMLDEPTSGLDSFMAREVMSFIRLLVVEQGITVATTIHQPSAAIFSMFDFLMLILRGKIVYFGEVCQVASNFTDLYSLRVGAQAQTSSKLIAAGAQAQVTDEEGERVGEPRCTALYNAFCAMLYLLHFLPCPCPCCCQHWLTMCAVYCSHSQPRRSRHGLHLHCRA